MTIVSDVSVKPVEQERQSLRKMPELPLAEQWSGKTGEDRLTCFRLGRHLARWQATVAGHTEPKRNSRHFPTWNTSARDTSQTRGPFDWLPHRQTWTPANVADARADPATGVSQVRF